MWPLLSTPVVTTSLRDTLQQSLGTSYRLERELGGGGMSRVFRAQDVSLGREVVVKVLPPELAEGLSAERFTREVRLAARLQHPHIVPVLAAGDADGLPYYTMPFVRGQSLRERLSHGGALPLGDALGILRDVARALAYAHGEGVVHRDIKPDNILLSGGAAMVADFGIAKAVFASVTSTGSITTGGIALGTPAYIAPEQALADPTADHRVDLYALGVVAWEVLVGRPMFGDRPARALIAAHIAEAPPDVASQRVDLPPALRTLVMRLVAKRPDDRPGSAAEVLRVLDAIGAPPEAATTAAATTAAASPVAAQSRRAWPRVAVLVGVLVLGAAGVAWWRTRSAPANVSANVIAIAPFRVAGADPSLGYLREGMVDLLAAKVGGTAGLRALDPRTTLATWRRATDSNEDLGTDDAMRVAHGLGAGRLILGEIAGTSANLTLSANLLPAAIGREPSTAIVTGPADSLPALIDRFAAQLMSLGSGEAAPRLTALTSTSLPALRAYLEGRALYRGGRPYLARTPYLRAVELDSTFTLAALGLVRTVGWGGLSLTDQARAMAVGGRIIRRGRDRLSPADAALAEASLGPRYPAPRTYREWLASAERLTVLTPESAEGWFELGDALAHGGGILGISDADERAIRAFSKVLALDSSFTLAHGHLATLYAEAGDTARAREVFASRTRADSTARIGHPGLAFAMLVGDSAAARSIRAGMDRLPPSMLYGFVLGALFNHYGLDEAQRALDLLSPQVITSDNKTAYTIYALRIATERGRPREAAAAASGMLASPAVARDVALTAALADGDSAAGAQAARALEPVVAAALATAPSGASADSASVSAEVALNDPVDAAFALAQYRLAMGDASAARRVIPWLRGYVPPKDSTWLGEYTAQRALLLDAQVAALEQRADAGDVLARLDSATRFGQHDPRFSTVSSLVTARLWEDRGDPRRALAALRRRNRIRGPNYYESTWQRELGRLAALAGEREAAIRAYRIYLLRRTNPEPALGVEVAQVRGELARLERASAGR